MTTSNSHSLRSSIRFVALVASAIVSSHCAGGEIDMAEPRIGHDGGWTESDANRGDAGLYVLADSGTRTDSGSVAADSGTPTPAPTGPLELPEGRTYDQQREYIGWDGPVSIVTLQHKDGSSLPSSEGGTFCDVTGGCSEHVTRIAAGGSIYGSFSFAETFNIMVATENVSDVGSARVEVCGQTLPLISLQGTGRGLPGFSNQPGGDFQVPTAGRCTWRVTAVGGFVDLRAVDVFHRTPTALPTVDLQVNGDNAPLTVYEPGAYTLTWTSTNATSCTASGAWTGGRPSSGMFGVTDQRRGNYTYTITCTNSLGSASDAVVVNVGVTPG